MLEIVKRDCSKTNFDKQKIFNAIMKAMKSGSGIVKSEIAEKIANEIENEVKSMEEIDIYQIEAMVFQKLIENNQILTAKAYESYRSVREFQRNTTNSTDDAILELLAGQSEYWNEENSNKNAMLITTQRDYMAGIESEDISKRMLLTPEIVHAHENGIIHFHDIDYFAMKAMYNCCLINLEDMLQNGTVISNVLIEKPHSFSTACNVATQIIAQVASSQFGGQTISLSHLAPFIDVSRQKIKKQVEKELINANLTSVEYHNLVDSIVAKRLKEEIKKGVQTIQYQVVTLMTTNGQAPFLSVFMYLNEVKDKQTKHDLAMLIEEVLLQRIQGVKNEKGVWVTPAFPKLLYVLEEDNIHKNSPYYYLTELAAKCTVKRMVPDYISEKKMKECKIDKNGKGQCFPCMGCRSFLSPYLDKNSQPKYYGRFNQGVVTINLADVALSALKEYEESKLNLHNTSVESIFWKILDERLELCHRTLRLRHERLKGTVSDVAPILWQHGAIARLNKGEKIDKLLYNDYSTISLGYAALYECVKAITKHTLTDNGIGEKFGLQVMQRLTDKCNQWKEEENIGYSVYGTPLESTTYKFAKCLRKRFGVIEGITDRDYVTNSYHIPVFENINAFDKLLIESKFQKLSAGGAISYVEVPNLTDNIEIVIQIIQYIYEHIMYAELNTKSDYCHVCGYDKEIEIVTDANTGKLIWKCPQCGNTDQRKMSVTRRTCGYLGSNFWNQGRTQEIKERVLHIDDMDLNESENV